MELKKHFYLLEVAEKYSELVLNTEYKESIFSDIKSEYERTVKMVLQITKEDQLCDRFPNFKRHFYRRLDALNQAGIEQVELVKKFRSKDPDDQVKYDVLIPLLLSINCVAAGIGSTG